MKIIIAGMSKEERQKPRPPWWVGKRIVCRQCSAIVQLEAGDKVVEESLRSSGGREARVDCPSCGCGLSVFHYFSCFGSPE